LPLLMIFIDGLGLGVADPEINPLAGDVMPFLKELHGGLPFILDTLRTGYHTTNLICRPTETTLGVAGLPQSATGQTVIFSGVNAARVAGRHISGFPTPTLCRILQEKSIFKVLNEAGFRTRFANVFTREYFEIVERGKWWHSVTTTAALAGGRRLLMVEDLQAGVAVYQDITNGQLQERGYAIPLIEPEEAAANLVRQVIQNDFTLFEYFQTDHCGHRQDWDGARVILRRLDRFLAAIFRQMDEARLDLLLVSDHGNIEDLSAKTHTFNPVPTLALGKRATEFDGIDSLLDIYPAVLRYFQPGFGGLNGFSR
jgi:2,3-bisphosphoglycerate-independent phosphoglycerate mutase